MAAQLQSINLVAPAFKGINLEDSPLAQEPSYAEVADNAIIDESGRIASRKGYEVITTDATELGTSVVRTIAKYKDDDGNELIFSVGNNKIFSGTTTLTDVTPGSYTITADNWKIVNFNENLYFFQRGHEPLVYNNADGLTVMSSATGAAGVTSAIYGNEVLAAYGRLWTADFSAEKSIVYWSGLLNGNNWSGSGTGSVDISDVWPQGYDEIVSLVAHNGFLIIMGKHSIVVYSGADGSNPATTLVLEDTVSGVGCVDRDTVEYTGTDVLFLAPTGLRSFSRTVQEKSMPLTDRSRNIKNRITALISDETESYRSVYSPENQFYLITFVGQNTTYCFDLRGELENAAYRVTRWPSTVFTAYYRDQDDGTLYVGTADGISSYTGYTDNGESYRFRYESPALSFGDSSRIKMLKKIKPTLVGADSQDVTIKWAYDFRGFQSSTTFPIDSQAVSYYNEAEFNVGQYSTGIVTTRRGVNVKGHGEVIAVGVEVDIDGTALSLQELNVLAIIGKMQ